MQSSIAEDRWLVELRRRSQSRRQSHSRKGDRMRTILAAAFALALSIVAVAQNAVPFVECAAVTPTQPCVATLEWDPVVATPTTPVAGYRCYLDGTLAATAQGQAVTTCVITVPAIGRHTAGVSAFNQSKESAQAPLVFDAILVAEAPAAPGNLRIRITVMPTGEQRAPFTAFGHA